MLKIGDATVVDTRGRTIAICVHRRNPAFCPAVAFYTWMVDDGMSLGPGLDRRCQDRTPLPASCALVCPTSGFR